jgi:Arc/MetJ family transcription regulator
MAVRRKSHNLDETLLRKAKRVLRAKTETEAIHGALRAILVGDEALADLDAVSGRRRVFRTEFVRSQQRLSSSR